MASWALRGITAFFTTLSRGGLQWEESAVSISSLIDTWLHLRPFEHGGERSRAAGLIRALRAGRAAARTGGSAAGPILRAARATLMREARPDGVDYLALVDPITFEPQRRRAGQGLLIAAIRIGRTRLIDNLDVPAPRGRAG